ncbi:MAG: Phosphate-import permease protein PhnE [Syntrophaceae bacterium PtaU1.Bin231]|nr:MAG: Phosphate-import permease protein PhnE [Syntrophaceae bacterium PtaU1.Bin231]
MPLADIKKKTNPFSAFNLTMIFLGLAVVTWSWSSTQMSVTALLDGWNNMIAYIRGNPEIAESGFFPPSLKSAGLNRYLLSMLETVQMAVLALILSVLIAFPLAFGASRNTLEILFPGRRIVSILLRKILYTTIRFFANLSRSINELVWALIFVAAVGLGPMPGILALGIHTSGVLIKLFSEGIENVQPEPVTALMATGAGPLKVIRYAVIPQITPYFVSMTLYRFESDVRSATILGFTGAGGIGVYLYDKLRSYENQDVTTILIVIVITVALVDRLSAVIRRRYT